MESNIYGEKLKVEWKMGYGVKNGIEEKEVDGKRVFFNENKKDKGANGRKMMEFRGSRGLQILRNFVIFW